jgi:hypothetical protein
MKEQSTYSLFRLCIIPAAWSGIRPCFSMATAPTSWSGIWSGPEKHTQQLHL